jgi:hypothetical protein
MEGSMSGSRSSTEGNSWAGSTQELSSYSLASWNKESKWNPMGNGLSCLEFAQRRSTRNDMEIIFRVHYVCFYFLVYARTIVGASNANEACRLQLQRMIHSHTFPNPASWLLSLRRGFDSILEAGAPCIAFHVQPQSLLSRRGAATIRASMLPQPDHIIDSSENVSACYLSFKNIT